MLALRYPLHVIRLQPTIVVVQDIRRIVVERGSAQPVWP
jgi:hypothetical protein